jgi:hypothetical protein
VTSMKPWIESGAAAIANFEYPMHRSCRIMHLGKESQERKNTTLESQDKLMTTENHLLHKITPTNPEEIRRDNEVTSTSPPFLKDSQRHWMNRQLPTIPLHFQIDQELSSFLQACTPSS